MRDLEPVFCVGGVERLKGLNIVLLFIITKISVYNYGNRYFRLFVRCSIVLNLVLPLTLVGYFEFFFLTYSAK